ncbi:RCC1 domain-containing protein [Cellulomonas taurus]|uniref:RCC1 domain-containing protein n=1 Tax=Cellulomonas taurus TaxID=2729175 RepID=UPI00197F3DDC|nr:IPT/TIG domain-containing protein [Cellulomonas taurus]
MSTVVRRSALAGVLAAGATASFVALAAVAVDPGYGSTAGGTTVAIDSPQFQFAQVDTSEEASIGVTTTGEIYAWGGGAILGEEQRSTVPTTIDTSIIGDATITQVAAAPTGFLGLALASDGRVYAWGESYGGVMTGATDVQFSTDLTPIDTSGALAGKTVTDIAVAYDAAAVVTSDGAVYVWGNTGYSLGTASDETSISSPTAVDMSGAMAGKTIVEVESGADTFIALASDGSLFTWGSNRFGNLGIGSTSEESGPVAVDTSALPPGTVFTAVAAGTTSYALTTTGQVYAWGRNDIGAAGVATDATSVTLPTLVDTGALAGATVTSMHAGLASVLVQLSDGSLVGWGDNHSGLLLSGGPEALSTPTRIDTSVFGTVTVTSYAIGYEHAVAVTDAATAWAWGDNGYGQLGDGGAVASSDTPVPVTVPGDAVTFDGVAATSVTRVNPTTLQAVTPAHIAGRVDVVVTTGNAVYTYPDAYAYGSPPVITTEPVGATTSAGASHTLTVVATGDDRPMITWQTSANGVGGWTSLTGATTSGTGDEVTSSITIPAGAAGSTVYVRAVASNVVSSTSSTVVAIAVPADPAPDATPAPTDDPVPTEDPSSTPAGSSAPDDPTPTESTAPVDPTSPGSGTPDGSGSTTDPGDRSDPGSGTVTDATVREVLAHTGSDPRWLLATGGVLLTAGALFVVMSRGPASDRGPDRAPVS